MSSNNVLDAVRIYFGDKDSINEADIEQKVIQMAPLYDISLSDEEISSIVRKLKTELSTTMKIGQIIKDKTDHKPWITLNKQNIDWYYWERYRRQLLENGFGSKVIGAMDIVTNDILDLLQNPKDDGSWQRKGLVVGHVQSGKTANYSAVICKALDSGYKIVIILAGLLNSLRRQTQIRADESIIGVDSSLSAKNLSLSEKLIGVGKNNRNQRPFSVTTVDGDFNKQYATQLQFEIEHSANPLIFVVKKNVSVIKNLIEWFKNNNLDLSKFPLLLIDDEADHASINTNNDDLNPTRTNQRIRELLELFQKNVYLGYTATPFANIFINPETDDDMMNDLFPENFIMTLDPPSNYFGADKIFLDQNSNVIRTVNDFFDFLPFSHKISQIPNFIPESLKTSIRVYILACTIRILRDQKNDHNSMLVNVSRFTVIQSEVRVMIHNYLTQLQNSILNFSSLNRDEALENSDLKELYTSWQNEYAKSTEFDWISIQSELKTAVSRIETIEVNSSFSAERDIDYSERNYPEGRHIIAIGGLSLSRGITLEGLSISYFLRNSMMYDTLMQMGRWFGYRIGYEDLCRIYLPEQAESWYKFIANVTNELREEFKKMRFANKTPKDFGLKVRNHPDSLLVTARNKMRTAQKITRNIELGSIVQTTRLSINKKHIDHNLRITDKLLGDLTKSHKKHEIKGRHLLFEDVQHDIVSDFVANFKNYPLSDKTEPISLSNFINRLCNEFNIKHWRVIFSNPTQSKSNMTSVYQNLSSLNYGERFTVRKIDKGIEFSSRKVAPGNFEDIDLKFFEETTREVPNLIIHLLDCRYSKEDNKSISKDGLIAYSLSLPDYNRGKQTLVTYQVNTVLFNDLFGDEFEDEDDLGNDL